MEKNKKLTLWFSMLVGNAIVLYVAYLFFPDYVVLGNAALTNWMAAIVTALVLTIILEFVKPILTAFKLKLKGNLAINSTYLVANVVGLWVLARLVNYVGFGISSFVVAIVLGVVLSLVQFGVWKIVVGK